jgi:hypothetical protein
MFHGFPKDGSMSMRDDDRHAVERQSRVIDGPQSIDEFVQVVGLLIRPLDEPPFRQLLHALNTRCGGVGKGLLAKLTPIVRLDGGPEKGGHDKDAGEETERDPVLHLLGVEPLQENQKENNKRLSKTGEIARESHHQFSEEDGYNRV